MEGNADIPCKATWIDNAERITEEREIHCQIRADFKNIAFDASAAFDDTLAEQIAPFDMKEGRDFDPVYLAGAYANIPDVDEETYRQKALEYAAQKSVDALGKKDMMTEVELTGYEDGSTLADHLPVRKESSYTALLPVWFMSFRRGKRIAYAAVNGSTGKVYSDIPVSLPAFWIGSFLTAIPIFILLNLFLTLQPANGLLAACFLALVGAILYAGNYITILRREEHLDDTGYQAAAGHTEVKAAAEQNRVIRWLKGQDDRSIPKVKRDWTYMVIRAFGMWPYLLITIAAAVMFPPLLWTFIVLGSAVYCIRKTGGRIAFWPALLIAAAGAGMIMRELPLVSDLWYYGGTTGSLKGHKFSLYEGGIRVPCLISWPGHIPPEQVIHEPCAAIDIFPTFLKMAGGDPSRYELDGADILGVLTDGGRSPHAELYWEMEDQTAMRMGDYKLVINGRLVESEKPQVPVFLADLKNDPGETVNLAEKMPELAEEMTKKAEAWRQGIEKTWEEKFADRYRSLT